MEIEDAADNKLHHRNRRKHLRDGSNVKFRICLIQQHVWMNGIPSGGRYKRLIVMGDKHSPREAISGRVGIQQDVNVLDQFGIIQGRPPGQ
jgi:hypothetical protein